MPLFERTITRTGGADHIERTPSSALGQNAPIVAAASAIALPADERARERIAMNIR